MPKDVGKYAKGMNESVYRSVFSEAIGSFLPVHLRRSVEENKYKGDGHLLNDGTTNSVQQWRAVVAEVAQTFIRHTHQNPAKRSIRSGSRVGFRPSNQSVPSQAAPSVAEAA